MSTQLSEFEKGQIVAFDKCNWSLTLIAKEISRSKPSISNFLKKYKETGDYTRTEGSGRKRKTTDSQDKEIVQYSKKQRTASAKIIKKELNLNVSKQTICNRLHEKGFWSHFQLKKPYVSEVNQKKRLEFAHEHLNWTLSKWKQVLWSDESPYVLRYQARQHVWRLPNERYKPFALTGTVKHDAKIMVWGCFSWSGVGHIHRINGIMVSIS